jgi:hypothetical protein
MEREAGKIYRMTGSLPATSLAIGRAVSRSPERISLDLPDGTSPQVT